MSLLRFRSFQANLLVLNCFNMCEVSLLAQEGNAAQCYDASWKVNVYIRSKPCVPLVYQSVNITKTEKFDGVSLNGLTHFFSSGFF